ncbi:MAG TPA: sialidase family protein [Gemmatimonadaceae bacterium]|nr:sialidase family protein [Gemmatimonadaceae bacterium]
MFAFVVTACASSAPTDGTPPESLPPDETPPSYEWSAPTNLFETDIRLAAGTALHAVGVTGGALVHRSSTDEGRTWSAGNTVAASGELPIYGPLAADGENVYLISRSGGALRTRRSTDGGATWSAPVALQGYSADNDDRVQMAAEGSSVHIFVGRAGIGGDASFKIYYWRSTDAGQSFGSVRILDENPVDQPSPGGIAVENGVVHIGYAAITKMGPLGHRARYMRSPDNGVTWSAPVDISGAGTNPQIRPRPRVLNGRVFVLWEEPLDYDQQGPLGNATISAIRINLSTDNGVTWLGTRDVAAVPATYLSHPEVAVGPSGMFHVAYRMSAAQSSLSITDEIGYRQSKDFGANWRAPEIAIDDPTQESAAVNLVATSRYIHLASAGGVYVRRQVR